MSPPPIWAKHVSSTQPALLPSLLDYLGGEISPRDPPTTSATAINSTLLVSKFWQVPVALERCMSLGFFICFDCFLDIFTLLPLRLAAAAAAGCLRLFTRRSGCVHPCACTGTYTRLIASLIVTLFTCTVYDALRAFLMAFTLLLLTQFDPGMAYHFIKSQHNFKLFVIYNLLEVLDRLACAFGHDILDALLCSTCALFRVPLKGISQPRSLLLALIHFTVALVYMALHSAIYFLQFTTLNVAFISSSTTLLTVLVSNNFVELKGSIFKKCGPENLFQLCGGDIVRPTLHLLLYNWRV
jgi:hypothetical protein